MDFFLLIYLVGGDHASIFISLIRFWPADLVNVGKQKFYYLRVVKDKKTNGYGLWSSLQGPSGFLPWLRNCGRCRKTEGCSFSGWKTFRVVLLATVESPAKTENRSIHVDLFSVFFYLIPGPSPSEKPARTYLRSSLWTEQSSVRAGVTVPK